mgnify:CR=1 FL=1
MPTPFTHLEAAQRLLADPALDRPARHLLEAERSAFLLGSVAADARPTPQSRREDTHFYTYDRPLTISPWRVMLDRHPALLAARQPAQRAFLAGYVAHLAMDEVWTLEMLGPHFAGREWAPHPFRFLMLHALLIFMDERDLARLDDWQPACLRAAQPAGWLPFMTDAVLVEWRDFISDQIKPGGPSLTLEIFGGRINRTPAELRALLDSPEQMQRGLWQHVSPALLASVEAAMYARAREQMLLYLGESQQPRL